MDITLIIPTRKRPQNIQRILKELRPVLNQGVELLLGIDEDDDSYPVADLNQIPGVKVVRTPATPFLSNLYNILFEYCSGKIIGYYGDDISFVDLTAFAEIRRVFSERGDVLYFFADRNQQPPMGAHPEARTPASTNPNPYPLCVPCHGLVTARSIRALGFLHMPNMEHGYADHYLGCIYKEVDRYHLHDPHNPFTIHQRPVQQIERDSPLWDEVYELKSAQKDENGLTADERDKVRFDTYAEQYLALHQRIILNLNSPAESKPFKKYVLRK